MTNLKFSPVIVNVSTLVFSGGVAGGCSAAGGCSIGNAAGGVCTGGVVSWVHPTARMTVAKSNIDTISVFIGKAPSPGFIKVVKEGMFWNVVCMMAL